jgi:hypothetical protein
LKDVKAALTNGGSSVAGEQVRTLNTIEGDSSFVALSSNRLKPSIGTYDIEVFAPAFSVDRHHAFLYNQTTASVVIIGTASYSITSFNGNSPSFVIGRFQANGTDEYEIRHFTQTAQAVSGLGVGNDTRSSVFTIVKLTKIK